MPALPAVVVACGLLCEGAIGGEIRSAQVTLGSVISRESDSAGGNERRSQVDLESPYVRPPAVESAEPLPTPGDEPPSATFGTAPSTPRSARGDLMTPGGDRAPIRFGTFFAPSRPVAGSAADAAMYGGFGALAAPLRIAPDGSGIWLATADVDYRAIDTTASFPDSGRPVPRELWNVGFGTMYFRRLDDGRRIGGIVSFGSASDRPFDEFRDLTLTSIGFLEIPFRDRDAWNFSLFYSPTSQLPYPMPGLAYVWRPDDRLTARLGIPFSLNYRPNDRWTLAADYRPLTEVRARATRALPGDWNAYAGYEMTADTYFLAERLRTADRLYLFEQRATFGLERRLPAGLRLDVSASYLFDRRIFQAESFFDGRHDALQIGSGAMLSLGLRWQR